MLAASCLLSSLQMTFQGPFQPTLPVIRREDEATFKSEVSGGNKQMVSDYLYLLVLEIDFNLFG